MPFAACAVFDSDVRTLERNWTERNWTVLNTEREKRGAEGEWEFHTLGWYL